ncbi:hypothetical protein E2C01_031365 [Portunus trituberculatus]|uniref:Uncharacterized protein n=1 Tax=Portunus trituberculatus TaxID=210409 RepID=A0A5B7ESP6_PORTR|nr:hypothetical protein [Portunus trituberculatus]
MSLEDEGKGKERPKRGGGGGGAEAAAGKKENKMSILLITFQHFFFIFLLPHSPHLTLSSSPYLPPYLLSDHDLFQSLSRPSQSYRPTTPDVN